MRSAVENRAEQVLRDHDTRSVVLAPIFDDLLTALDAPAQKGDALTRAARRASRLVTR